MQFFGFIWFSTESVATYLVGLVVLAGGLIQINHTLRLNKRSSVFHDLSVNISEAKRLIGEIGISVDLVTQQLADQANIAIKPIEQLNEADRIAENKRRHKDINLWEENMKANARAIHDGYVEAIKLVEKIEKSTVISEKSKEAARYMFYATLDQNELMNAANGVLISIQVHPPVGDKPNVSAQTFNEFVNLLKRIQSRNIDLQNYLDDLDVILHNDLVKGVFGRASAATVPEKHLTIYGIKDKRVKNSLR